MSYNDFYDYDLGNGTNVTYDTNNLDFNWNELLPTLIVYGVTFILGLTGNILIIFTTFKYRRMKSVTNVFLSSLASSDLILIIVCIPVKVAKLFSYTWEMGAVVCKVIHYMQYVSAICSVLTLTAISIERYYAIAHPMKAKYVCTISQAKKIILLIWILSIILGVPTLKAQLHLPVGRYNESNYCVRGWDDNPEVHKFHELYMLMLILIGPFCIMTVSYGLICWEIWKVMERRSTMTCENVLSRTAKSIPRNEKLLESFGVKGSKKVKAKNGTRDDTTMVKQVVCMLVTVVILFAFCWTPMLVDNVLTAYGVLPYMKFGTLKYMSNVFCLMAYFNSCINPIIYGFMSKNFRDSFVQILCWKSDNRPIHERSSTYSLRYISARGSSVKSNVTRSTSLK